jgi:hypothetical protein
MRKKEKRRKTKKQKEGVWERERVNKRERRARKNTKKDFENKNCLLIFKIVSKKYRQKKKERSNTDKTPQIFKKTISYSKEKISRILNFNTI